MGNFVINSYYFEIFENNNCWDDAKPREFRKNVIFQ